MKLSASIVTYNSIIDIDGVLSTLSAPEGTDLDIYVIDNASTDGTSAYVERNYPGVRLIRNPRNIGFGAAHNLAIRLADSDYHMIVNPDIKVEASEIGKMISYMEDHPDTVLLSPLVMSPDGTVQYLPKRYPTLRYLMSGFLENRSERFRRIRAEYTMKDELGEDPREVDFCTGCFMFVRTSALKEIGGFDEGYFLHFEDADLTRMLKRCGKTVYFPLARVTHGWHRDNRKLGKVFFISLRSMMRYFFKWTGKE